MAWLNPELSLRKLARDRIEKRLQLGNLEMSEKEEKSAMAARYASFLS